MVGILEIDNNVSWKARLLQRWKRESKIELVLGIGIFAAIMIYGDQKFLAAGLAGFAGLWSLVRMFFDKRGQKKIFFLMSLFFFYVGLERLFGK